MDKKLKTAIIVILSLAFALAFTVAGVKTVKDAAVSDGNDTREEIIRLFNANAGMYDSVFDALLQTVPAGREYLIITDGENAGDVKVQYGSVEDKASEALSELIENFAGITHCDAIYSDGSRLYVKRNFVSAIDRMSEADIFRSFDPESELPKNAKELSNGWYYAERELE